MFTQLTERLSQTFKNLSGRGRLSEANIQESLRDVRRALLEADVALPVVNTLIQQIQQTAIGTAVHQSLTPNQAFLKIVERELITLMGSQHQPLQLQTTPPAVILLVGLQGAGKTTTAAKLARYLQQTSKRKVLLASTDTYRPAAIQQLQRLAESIAVDFFTTRETEPLAIAQAAHQQAQLQKKSVTGFDRGCRTFNQKQAVTLMLHSNKPIIKHKVGLLNLAKELNNVSQACKVTGVSRDMFYRYQELVEEGGVEALVNRSRRISNLKNRTDEATKQAVIDYAIEFPAHGQRRASNELRKQGIFISAIKECISYLSGHKVFGISSSAFYVAAEQHFIIVR